MELPKPTTEQVKLGRKIARQRWALNKAWANLNYVRCVHIIKLLMLTFRLALGFVGFVWVLLLPHRALWKTTWVDENALSPAQATVYYDWADVHRADRYLDDIEKLGCDASWDGRKELLLHAFANAGVEAGNTTDAVWARVTPPRSEGTEALLVSANWLSRDGVCNKRGVALLLSLADFLRCELYMQCVLIISTEPLGFRHLSGSWRRLLAWPERLYDSIPPTSEHLECDQYRLSISLL